MAIEQLATTQGLQEAADNGQELILELTNLLLKSTGTSQLVDAVIQRLKNYIIALEQEETNLLKRFNVSSESELQNKFNNFYNNSGLINLSGPELERTILDAYQSSLNADTAKIKQFIDQQIIPAMAGVTKDVMQEDGVKILAEQFNELLGGMVVTITEQGGKVSFNRKTSSSKPISFDARTGRWSILASKLTSAQKRRILAIMEHQDLLPKKAFNFDSYVINNGIVTQVSFDWSDITSDSNGQAMTKTDAKQLDVHDLNRRNNYICDLIASKVNPYYQDLVRSYLNRMTYTDPYLFFVGKNTKGITGIVGELSALVAIEQLLSGVDKHKIIDWVANHKVNKKDLSIDILLKDLAGIQVKNTSKDFATIPELRIDFADASAYSILNKLEAAYGLNFKDLETIFESEAFNVPAAAIGRGGKLREVGIDFNFTKGGQPDDWGDFVEAYNTMQSVIFDTKQFMSAFAPDFLYMSGGSDFENQLANLDRALTGSVNSAGFARANTLYLVAGVPFFASSMLKTIQNNLQKLETLKNKARTFDIKSSLGTYVEGNKKVPYNYVAYKSKKGGDASKRHVKLTSSYGFTKD